MTNGCLRLKRRPRLLSVMKIVYCHCSLFNPGGMERVLLNKVRWLSAAGHQVLVVTTDQQGRPPFYDFPAEVGMADLDINYSLDNNKSLRERIPSYLRKRRLHRRRLTELLMRERPDVVVSLYPSESSFIPDIHDGSRKVLELHFNRFFRQQYGRSGLIGLIDRWRSRQDVKIARRFDRFVVLTEEDKGYWGDMPNIAVIPNAALPMPQTSACSARRVIAVGRLDFQKGFDRLVDAWELVKKDKAFAGWRLDIFGQGEWRDLLCARIKAKGLADSAAVNAPTSSIADEYAASSILAMTSNYEGFPMVMIEAMSAGLPVVTFDYKCGPRDIITAGIDGLVVKNGDIRAFADALLKLMADDTRRKAMGAAARSVTDRYSESNVMAQWTALFDNLV